MEEIKANEILRTADGKLYKIVSATKDDFLCLEMRENSTRVELLSDLNPIVKHSPNIIDLIEEGDYVNGVEVVDLDDGIHLKFANNVSFVDVGISTYMDGHVEGIKSIVTKEQFNQMKYIVGDESNE